MLLSLAFSQNLYPISEPDLLEEIEKRTERVLRSLEKGNYRFGNLWEVSLPLAKKSFSYEVDFLYTLEEDVPRVDERGRVVGILYPKGYRFNPLHYASFLPPTLIVFDGEDRRQVRHVKTLLSRYPDRMLIASRGDYGKLLELFGEKVYFLHPRLRTKLRLNHGISLVRWDKVKGVAHVEVIGCDRIGCKPEF